MIWWAGASASVHPLARTIVPAAAAELMWGVWAHGVSAPLQAPGLVVPSAKVTV